MSSLHQIFPYETGAKPPAFLLMPRAANDTSPRSLWEKIKHALPRLSA